MSDIEAIDLAEGYVDAERPEQYYEAWQHLIDTGLAWRLQGWFGRHAMMLIEEDHCKPPKPQQDKHFKF
jgi:hypothetical protein